jgi:hypothetical protein
MCAIQTTQNQGQPYSYDPDLDEEYYGAKAQRNYNFLELLWDAANGTTFRADLIAKAQASQADLLADSSIVDLQLNLPPDVYIVLLDLESGRLVYEDTRPPPDPFYILMLPATPKRRLGSRSYKNAQQWDEAWHHAVRETGGM